MSTKKYADNAQRQAAYRSRHLASKPATEAELAVLARSLHIVLGNALAEETTDLPASIVGGHAGTTMRRLIHYLDPYPDPVRYAGQEKPC